jgi:RNA polymerase sigma factor (sigma-70 family)
MNEKDSIIIQSIHSGAHSAALQYLYDVSLKKVRGHIMKNSGSREDANDIFQDAVIILFNQVRLGKFNESNSIDGFIFSISKNLWIDKVRRNKKFTNYDSPDQFNTISDSVNILDDLITKEKSHAMREAFNLLDEKCQKILTYVIFEKRTMKEVSSLMNYSSDDVAKTNHYRCKQYLSKLVKNNPRLIKLLSN